MPVIVVNRFFHPDLSATSQFVSDLAFALAAEGRSVRVVTGRLRYEDPSAPPLPAHEVVAGVGVHRVRTSRFGRARLLGRAADYLTFYLSAAWCLWRLVRPGDVVIVKTDPPLISVVAAAICRLRRARQVNWLQDLFPEVAQAFGIGGPRFLHRILARLRDASLRAAAVNVVIGHAMAARVEASGLPPARIRLIPNWADRSAVRPVAHADNPFRRMVVGTAKDPFVVVYSGNLGRVHEIDTMVAAMAILARESAGESAREAADGAGGRRPVRWVFIGSGALTPQLQAEVARRGFGTVAFLPYQPRSALAHSLSAADAHLACLRPEFEGLVVPSKVSGAAAAGRPILFVGDPDGEIGRFVTRHGCGTAIPCGDGAGLARAIRDLAADPAACAAMGDRARAAFDAEFDRDAALDRWRRLLDEVEAGPPA